MRSAAPAPPVLPKKAADAITIEGIRCLRKLEMAILILLRAWTELDRCIYMYLFWNADYPGASLLAAR